MRFPIGLTLLAAIILAGCGENSKTTGKNGKPGENNVGDGKGEIVKPEMPPDPIPAPEESELAKLGTAELVAELGKPHARDVASKLLLAKGESVVPELVAALKHENWQVRAGAVFTLGQLGAKAESALPELKKLQASETNETVKDSIPYCLDAIAGK